LERPEEHIQVPDKPTFVDTDEANGLLAYDPDTGDIFIESWGLPMYHVQLTSPSGLLVGATPSEADRYAPHLFDHANPERFNRMAIDGDVVFVDGVPDVSTFTLPGFHTVNLPEIAEVGLTESEFLEDIQPEGQLDPSGRLKLAFTIGPTFGLCRELVEQGTLIGDANQDGRFDSQDLVTVFQANEYRDEQEDNSTWSEGDWTCDGDFDTDDLVAAFQSGQYEQPVAAIAAGLDFDRGRSFRVNYDVDHRGVTDVTKARTHGTLATNRRWLSEFELVHMPQVHSELTLRLNEQSLVHADAVNRDLVDIALGDEFYFLWPE
jgi:hypothetical protein